MYKFEKLEIWHESLEIVKLIYFLSGKLPFDEKDNLINQIKRSSTSVSLNIAEGSGSQNDKEFKRYLFIAKKSLFEVVAILKIIKFIYKVDVKEVEDKSVVLIKRLSTLISKLY